MSNIKELIRQEIERRKGYISVTHFAEDLLSFIGTLPDESEQPTRGYDEAYLNEKIAKASKSWGGVDVDKFMDEIRGREPVTDCHELKEEIERTYHDGSVADTDDMDHVDYENIARHFAEWQKRKQPKVKGYGVMRKMEDPHPDDWYMDERGKEHCWGYKFNEPCPWPAEVYIMEAKEGAEQ